MEKVIIAKVIEAVQRICMHHTLHHTFGTIQFNTFMVTSNPRKHAALAGKALSITGVKPLNKPLGPSVRICKKKSYAHCNTCCSQYMPTMSLKTWPIPEYFPGGEVCNRDLRVSGAIATTQLMTPAEPPASRIRRGLSSSRLP